MQKRKDAWAWAGKLAATSSEWKSIVSNVKTMHGQKLHSKQMSSGAQRARGLALIDILTSHKDFTATPRCKFLQREHVAAIKNKGKKTKGAWADNGSRRDTNF